MCLWVFFLLDVFSLFFFFKQKTAYEVRISDWSSDVCSSDLSNAWHRSSACKGVGESPGGRDDGGLGFEKGVEPFEAVLAAPAARLDAAIGRRPAAVAIGVDPNRSAEHTSELQSLMRISYAVFCLQQKSIKLSTCSLSYYS